MLSSLAESGLCFLEGPSNTVSRRQYQSKAGLEHLRHVNSLGIAIQELVVP